MLGLDDQAGSTASKRLLVRFRIRLVTNIKNSLRDLIITCWSQKRSQLYSPFTLVSSIEFFQNYTIDAGLCYSRPLDAGLLTCWDLGTRRRCLLVSCRNLFFSLLSHASFAPLYDSKRTSISY